jgi:hypothetical protein
MGTKPEGDRLAEATRWARLWLAEYEATHPPTPRERLEDVVGRLSAKYRPYEGQPTLTLIQGGREDG